MSSLLGVVQSATDPVDTPAVHLGAVKPELVLIVAALLLMLASALTTSRITAGYGASFTALAGAVSLAVVPDMWHHVYADGPMSAFDGAIVFDRFAVFATVVVSITVILGALISESWLRKRNVDGPEYFVLMLLSAAGAMLMAAANDLIVVFLGLEILSIALYVLVGFNRRSEQSREAAMKYFLLGSFASAIFLYGIALTYGAVGSTNLEKIGTFLGANTILDDSLLLAGMVMMGVGFAFKVAAVPFQQWSPDVYVGAPTPVVGYMAALAKAGAFTAMLRVFAETFYSYKNEWQPVVLVIAVLTLFVGAVVACVQSNVKRMLAYSSISHAGFIILGLQAANVDGVSASLFYLFTYTFMVAGSFAIVMVVGGRDDDNHDLRAYRGLGRRQPGIGLAFTVLLLAQAGLPLTSGFVAKFSLMQALVENGSYALATFAMLTAAIAAFFYLRVVVTMYATRTIDEDEETTTGDAPIVVGAGGVLTTQPVSVLPVAVKLTLAVALAFTIGLGVLPQADHVVDLTRSAAADLFAAK
jgi:NADH-quinone oxidoreductase subunit N